MFVISVCIATSSYILESTFIAYREAKYVFRKNLIFGVAKIILPICLISLGAFGIYSSYTIALLAAVLYSLFIVKIRFLDTFTIKMFVSVSPLRGMFKYSAQNYVATFVEGLPVIILPFMVIYLFGAAATAHYNISMAIATVLFTVGVSATQSLFAEGSHSTDRLREETIRAAKYIALLAGPGMLLIVILGPRVLAIFGPGYEQEGLGALYLFSASAVFVALNSIARTILNLQFRTTARMIVEVVGTLSIVSLAYLLRGHGLNGVGIAWLLGQGLALVCFAAALLHRPRVAISP